MQCFPRFRFAQRDAENDEEVSCTSSANFCHFRGSPKANLLHHEELVVVAELE